MPRPGRLGVLLLSLGLSSAPLLAAAVVTPSTPVATQTPAATPAPAATQTPAATPAPAATRAPAATPAPTATRTPAAPPAPAAARAIVAAPAPTSPSAVQPELSVPDGWCVIAGEEPLTALPRALKRAERMRAAGYPAGVYDTRDFNNLAWGELVIIAQGFGGPAARAQATQLAAAMVKARGPRRVAEAYAKPCKPTFHGAKAITQDIELDPLPSLSTAPVDLSAEPEDGCLAWSARDRAALCYVGAVGNVFDNKWGMRFLVLGTRPAPDIDLTLPNQPRSKTRDRPALTPAQLTSLQSIVSSHGYVSLDGLQHEIGPNSVDHYAAPRFSVRWTRSRTWAGGDNSAPKYDDSIYLRCGGPSADERAFITESGAHESPSGTVTIIPADKGGGAVVLLTAHFHRADEGEFGTKMVAVAIDLASCASIE